MGNHVTAEKGRGTRKDLTVIVKKIVLKVSIKAFWYVLSNFRHKKKIQAIIIQNIQ